ncbi:hypothetical protein [Photobacterium leiognathi]|uniref:hypothetical protein n=1 Tax=Photobacterium leiognathi TaxID=553611 RepID=UPI002982B2F0|nr:hypothetical protein [Photobacterium leiognathi]
MQIYRLPTKKAQFHLLRFNARKKLRQMELSNMCYFDFDETTNEIVTNANNRKCNASRISTVDDIYSRALELYEDYDIDRLELTCFGTVMLFAGDEVIFNSHIHAKDGYISVSNLLNILGRVKPDLKIQSFNKHWSINGLMGKRRFVLLDASKAELFVMQEISFDKYKDHLDNNVNVALGDYSYDRFAELMGLDSPYQLAPVLNSEVDTVKEWERTDSIPLGIAVRAGVICKANNAYLQTGTESKYLQ